MDDVLNSVCLPYLAKYVGRPTDDQNDSRGIERGSVLNDGEVCTTSK
jgi:hypothetical protein